MNQQEDKVSDGRVIQITGWLVLYAISVLFNLPLSSYTLPKAFIAPLITLSSYMLIIYINVLGLIPSYFETRRYLLYTISVIVLLALGTALRVWASYEILNQHFNDPGYSYSSYNWGATLFKSITVLLVSILFYTMIRYFKLRKRHEEIESLRYKAELDLLKAHLQPHFLFNTLNNIYYEAHKESPRSAELVEKLSILMRYFVDENPKDKVTLEKELEFISNYIDLERIRMRFPIDLKFKHPSALNVMLPPMLLMPFVENLFKHGIDKDKKDNYAHINLDITNHTLTFSVLNRLHADPDKKESGIGLQNLKKRLQVLYGKNFTLYTTEKESQYESKLTIPIE
jgi:sensor histidine kinase YesM